MSTTFTSQSSLYFIIRAGSQLGQPHKFGFVVINQHTNGSLNVCSCVEANTIFNLWVLEEQDVHKGFFVTCFPTNRNCDVSI